MNRNAKKPQSVQNKADKNKLTVEGPAARNVVHQKLMERGTAGAGRHKNPGDYAKGKARNPKHKGERVDRMASEVVSRYLTACAKSGRTPTED